MHFPISISKSMFWNCSFQYQYQYYQNFDFSKFCPMSDTQTITLYEHLSLTYPIKETLEEPFEAVETGIVPLSIHVFLQSWQKLFHNFIMMILKTKKFRKSLNEETCKKKTHKLWMLSMNGRVENKSNSNLLCFRFMHSKKFQAGSEFNQNTYDGRKMNAVWV